jgi:hypothetical protein
VCSVSCPYPPPSVQDNFNTIPGPISGGQVNQVEIVENKDEFIGGAKRKNLYIY